MIYVLAGTLEQARHWVQEFGGGPAPAMYPGAGMPKGYTWVDVSSVAQSEKATNGWWWEPGDELRIAGPYSSAPAVIEAAERLGVPEPEVAAAWGWYEAWI